MVRSIHRDYLLELSQSTLSASIYDPPSMKVSCHLIYAHNRRSHLPASYPNPPADAFPLSQRSDIYTYLTFVTLPISLVDKSVSLIGPVTQVQTQGKTDTGVTLARILHLGPT